MLHSGDLDINDAYAARYAARDLLVANNCRKVLVDVRQANPLLSADERELFLRSHRNLLPLGCRIALVVDEQILLNKKAVEKLSMVPGVLQRVFSDEAAALQWLWEI